MRVRCAADLADVHAFAPSASTVDASPSSANANASISAMMKASDLRGFIAGSPPDPRSEMGMAGAGGKLYVLGGWDGNAYGETRRVEDGGEVGRCERRGDRGRVRSGPQECSVPFVSFRACACVSPGASGSRAKD
eukprot:2803884-Rhodomonas_salina.1